MLCSFYEVLPDGRLRHRPPTAVGERRTEHSSRTDSTVEEADAAGGSSLAVSRSRHAEETSTWPRQPVECAALSGVSESRLHAASIDVTRGVEEERDDSESVGESDSVATSVDSFEAGEVAL